MAKIIEMTENQQKEWNKWLKTRPAIIREVATKYPADKLYLLKTTNQRVEIISYFEDGTVKVFVSGKYNLCDFEHHVFGINPDDLEECDLPNPGEKIGAILQNKKDIEKYIDYIRPFVLAEKAKP